ncbi:hypothetical protein T03_429 [Trichinella britovi]|uniref:Uncharacterized protein n=1 Tax=Trichinella britovi TaxID=45882 RepID=A0A0V1D074_TRIBR|nr:hypothetical protein T03_429 [Trichinella britovi]
MSAFITIKLTIKYKSGKKSERKEKLLSHASGALATWKYLHRKVAAISAAWTAASLLNQRVKRLVNNFDTSVCPYLFLLAFSIFPSHHSPIFTFILIYCKHAGQQQPPLRLFVAFQLEYCHGSWIK